MLEKGTPDVIYVPLRTFAAGNKIKQFYELLVEDSLRREDVEKMSRENMKNLHEIMQVRTKGKQMSVDNAGYFQSFRFSNVCFWSYLSRTVLEIFLSIGLFLIYWCWGMPNLKRNIDCDVHGLKWVDCRIYKCLENSRTISELYLFWLSATSFLIFNQVYFSTTNHLYACTTYFRHMCVLPNHQFYFCILTVSSGLLCIYILCNLYNLVKLNNYVFGPNCESKVTIYFSAGLSGLRWVWCTGSSENIEMRWTFAHSSQENPS